MTRQDFEKVTKQLKEINFTLNITNCTVSSCKTLINYNILISMTQSQDGRRLVLIMISPYYTHHWKLSSLCTVEAIQSGSSMITSVEDQMSKLHQFGITNFKSEIQKPSHVKKPKVNCNHALHCLSRKPFLLQFHKNVIPLLSESHFSSILSII